MSDNNGCGCPTTVNTPSYSQPGSRVPSMTVDRVTSCLTPDKAELDIVLLGESGVGKSSLINMLKGENVAEVSPDTMPCTELPATYTLEWSGKTLRLHDTPGLLDPQLGIQHFINPIDKIDKLIHQLDDRKGPDLLLFCVSNTKPTSSLKRNYHLLLKVVCRRRVPSAFVVTKLREGQTSDRWWHEYHATIEQYNINCRNHLGFGCGNHNMGMDKQTRESFMSFFVSCTERQKYESNLLRSSFTKSLDSVAHFIHPRAWTRKVLTSQCGLDEESAKELARRLVH